MSKIKVTGNVCGYILNELASIPKGADVEPAEFLAIAELEDNLTTVLNRAKAAIEKTGYAPEDSDVAAKREGAEDLTKDEKKAISRHKKMNEISIEPQEVEGLPKDFKMPKLGFGIMRILYDMKEK